MGDTHPAERKVVLQFAPDDLDLTPVQKRKLIKLAGRRYNPELEVVKMSCESFDHQAQNKRHLVELVKKLMEAARVCPFRRTRIPHRHEGIATLTGTGSYRYV
jgi:small subunit ribosomal protein S35